MDVMLHYPWPGNVRELENAMERGVILMRGDYLDEDILPIPIKKWAQQESGAFKNGPNRKAEHLQLEWKVCHPLWRKLKRW
jgi:two-component system response regulator HydG